MRVEQGRMRSGTCGQTIGAAGDEMAFYPGFGPLRQVRAGNGTAEEDAGHADARTIRDAHVPDTIEWTMSTATTGNAKSLHAAAAPTARPAQPGRPRRVPLGDADVQLVLHLGAGEVLLDLAQ